MQCVCYGLNDKQPLVLAVLAFTIPLLCFACRMILWVQYKSHKTVAGGTEKKYKTQTTSAPILPSTVSAISLA